MAEGKKQSSEYEVDGKVGRRRETHLDKHK